MRKPYLIATPPFNPTSGGIRVMWGLYGWLLAKGQAAFVNSGIDVPAVGIYPEIFHGNELFAQKVIRYILQKPGMMGMGTPGTDTFKAGPEAFDPKDELYVFSRIYDEWQSDEDHILFLPIIDMHTFKDLGLKRNRIAFYVGKGVNRGQHPEGALEIKKNETGDQEVLAKLLNECKVLYIYDPVSALMECARLCGCPVVYLGDMPEEQLKLYEPGMNGLGYKTEVKLDISSFRTHYDSLGRVFSEKLDRFIDHTQA